MKSLQDEIRQNYVDGVYSLVNGKLKKTDILARISGVFIDDSLESNAVASSFCKLTERLLNTKMSDDGILTERNMEEDISSNFLNGIVESISQKVWERSYGNFLNPRKECNPYWMENKITDVFMDLVGCDIATLGFFQNPSLMFKMMQDIQYKNGSLLEYLNYHIDDAVKFNVSDHYKKHIEDALSVVDCVEALSECSTKLNILESGKKYVK